MLIGTNGVLIRTRVREIREMSRATQGVTLINLGAGEKLASLSRIAETEEIVEAGDVQADTTPDATPDAGTDNAAE
jgi:DNA gyrase subunit A